MHSRSWKSYYVYTHPMQAMSTTNINVISAAQEITYNIRPHLTQEWIKCSLTWTWFIILKNVKNSTD